MAALTGERDTTQYARDYEMEYTQKGNTKIYNGSIVCADVNGLANPGADVANYHALGRANATAIV